MKTKISHLGRSTVSVILAVMMLLSTMLIGTVSTVNAVTIPAGTKIYLDISNATANFTDPEIYVSVTDSSNNSYSADSSDTSGANSYKPKSDTWYKMTKVETNIYQATISSKSSVGKVSFWNKNESGYDDVWQASCTLGRTYDGTNNLFTLSGSPTYNEGRNSNIYSGTWSTYSGGSTTEKNYYVAGSDALVNGNAWTLMQDKDKMDYSESDKVYSITYTNKIKQKYLFKLNYENNWNSALGSSYVDNSKCVGSTLADDGGAIQINFSDDVTTPANITIKYSLSTSKIWTEVVSNVTTHTVTYGVNKIYQWVLFPLRV